MPAWLVETSGERAGRTHLLEPDAPITIGRAPDNAIVVPHVNASRRHARVWCDAATWFVEDLGTKNGTFKDRRLLAGAEPLTEGDEISLPGLILTFHASDETMTVAIRAEARPSTTKTFLFSDLRDYTSFVERSGDDAANELVAEYRRLVRGEIRRVGGHELKTEGDSFFVVFDSAHQGVQCALGIVRAASEHTRRSPDRPIRVGIGLHAGEPTMQRDQYVGIAVNIAARLAQNAGANEILISDVVRGLLRGAATPPMTPREGLSLKGIQDPPPVFAIAV